MEDNRIIIINSIIESMKDKISAQALYDLQEVLFLELNQYDIKKYKGKDLYIQDDSMMLLRKYLAAKKLSGLSEATLKHYAFENEKMIRFMQKPIWKITTQDLRYYLSYRRDESNLSNRTLNNMRLCYSSFFSYLTEENIIENNPCLTLSQIKFRKTINKPFSSMEIERLREACTNKRDLALIDFLYSTGCRVSEVTQLNISDINFEDGECFVLGKGNKERVVYLTDIALMHLEEYLDSRDDMQDALFIGKGGYRLSKDGIEKALKRLGKNANVDDVYPHRYRRTLATNLLDRGMDIQDVAKILGHNDLKTTQIYCYIDQTNVKNAYRRYAN